MITCEQLESWLHANDIRYRINGYSVYITNCKYLFRMNSYLQVTEHTVYPQKADKRYFTNKNIEAQVQTQCLLWGIEYRPPNRA